MFTVGSKLPDDLFAMLCNIDLQDIDALCGKGMDLYMLCSTKLPRLLKVQDSHGECKEVSPTQDNRRYSACLVTLANKEVAYITAGASGLHHSGGPGGPNGQK